MLVPSQAAGVRMGGSVQDEAVLVEEVARGVDDLGADAQDGRLARRAHPEMAVLHQEVDAVLLERNGVGIVLGHALHDLDAFYIQFVAARSTLVGAHVAGDDEGRFLRQTLEGVPHLGRDLLLTTTPWMMPLPSRKMGKSSLPLSRRL